MGRINTHGHHLGLAVLLVHMVLEASSPRKSVARSLSKQIEICLKQKETRITLPTRFKLDFEFNEQDIVFGLLWVNPLE